MQLDGNGSGVSSVSTIMGVNAVTSGNLVQGNRVAGNPFQGIGLTGSNNVISGNRIVGGGGNGIRVGAIGGTTPVSTGSRVESNQLSEGRISLNNTANTVVRGNQVAGSPLTGIFVANSQNAQVQGNQVANSADGIGVQTSTGTVVSDNAAVANTDDGFDIGSPGTVLARNTAYQNRDFGITAAPGVVDGGGNKASANGNPAQCSPNIVCT
jgi:parallel beta-helix repeat protein